MEALKSVFQKLLTSLLILLFMSGATFGSTVEKINKKKGLLLIDEGKAAGLKPKTKVCIFESDGKKVACGSITKVKENKAYVKVSKKKIDKITKGMEVKLADGADAKDSGGSKTTYSYVKGAYIISPMTTSSYQKVSYLRPDSNSVDTLWKPSETSSLSIFGFGGEVGLDLSSMLIAAGAKIKRHRDFTAVADYDNNPDNYVENNQVSQSFGVWLDAYWTSISLGSSKLDIGNGLDIDMSTMVLNAAKKSDAGDESQIYKATSKITVMSLRTVASYKMFFDPIGISADVNVMVPLVASGSSFSAEVTDGNTSSLTTDPTEDLKFAVNHRKSSLGLEFVLGAFFAF